MGEETTEHQIRCPHCNKINETAMVKDLVCAQCGESVFQSQRMRKMKDDEGGKGEWNVKGVFLSGLTTGALVGLLACTITKIPLGTHSDGYTITLMYNLWSACLVAIGIPLISAFSVRYCSKLVGCCEPSLKQLIPVALLTFFLPVLGPIFGGSGEFIEIPKITLLGALGGLFWSLPFIYFTRKKDEVS